MDKNCPPKKIGTLIEKWILFLDRAPLWVLGFGLLAVDLLPCLILGKGAVFPIHDQLDETLLAYTLNGKYLGTGSDFLPEMLGGINASGLQPSAVLFVPLYRILPPFTAFLIQWSIVILAAFFGMYFCTRELTGSNILAAAAAVWFSMLPSPPIYGLSVAGVPLLLCCILWLFQGKKRWLSFFLILLFGLTTHLVLIGYVVLSLWLFALLWIEIKNRWKKRPGRWLPWLGFGWLTFIYLIVNRSLFLELILKRSTYTSHREELVNYSAPFWQTVGNVFLNSAQHAQSFHKYFILPVLFFLILGGLFYRRMKSAERKRFAAALGGMILLILIAVFYGVCFWQPVVAWKNHVSGFLRYFQADRFYWLYPAGWCLEFILCFSLWWNLSAESETSGWLSRINSHLVKAAVLAALLFPAWLELKPETYLYLNVNQINNGSEITGYISWDSFFAEDLMRELENAIGRDITSYRVAHLGISPAPALMHGFYTADGYSNNYPLEYKHQFRKVIAAELEKNEATRLYFDQWGSRCYLFNGSSGATWMLGKKQKIVYEKLDFDMDALRSLNCEYLFSCGEILNADDLGIKCLGYFETETSYWGIWLYQL